MTTPIYIRGRACVSVPQAARDKGVTTEAIYVACRQRRLKSSLVDGRRWVWRASLRRWTPSASAQAAARARDAKAERGTQDG